MHIKCSSARQARGGGWEAADLALAKQNKIPKFLCTDAWSTAVGITSRNHRGKTLQMLSFMGPSAEKERTPSQVAEPKIGENM